MDELLKAIDEKYGPQFEELTSKAAELTEAVKEGNADSETKDKLAEIEQAVNSLTEARDNEIRQAEQKAMQTRIESLEEALKSASEGAKSEFSLGPVKEEGQKAIYGSDSEHSFFVDARNATIKSDQEALQRWTEAVGEKAMTSAQGTTGGYLVPPQVSNELLRVREQNNILRGLFSQLSVNSDTLRIAQVKNGLLAGWVAELAEKPLSELSFGEISVNTFTKAGMAVVSNQLLRDSNPSVDRLIYNDLGKRLAALEEIAFIDGTGNGQPLGILRTEGVQSNADNPLTSSDVDDLLDAVIDAITAIFENYFGAPNAIVMHPRDWARIVKARKADATAEYVISPPKERDSVDPLPGYGSGPNPTGRLFGLPVYTTRNVPANKGTNNNETRIIVGNFSEGLILNHHGVTLDSSEHVFFTTNQTIFRAEDQVGFTASRYPKAFYVIGGSGLAA